MLVYESRALQPLIIVRVGDDVARAHADVFLFSVAPCMNP